MTPGSWPNMSWDVRSLELTAMIPGNALQPPPVWQEFDMAQVSRIFEKSLVPCWPNLANRASTSSSHDLAKMMKIFEFLLSRLSEISVPERLM
jgi:hypothetical protein